MRSDNENQLAYEVRISQGEDKIVTDEDLLEQLANSALRKNGIISAKQISSNVWRVLTNKNQQ